MSENTENSGTSNPNIRIWNIQGEILNIGGHQSYEGDINVTMSDLAQPINRRDDIAVLAELLMRLKAALEKAPSDQQAGAQKVAGRVDELVKEVIAAEVDADGVEAKANLLKKAAENIAGALPTVLTIATQIVGHAMKMSGLA